MKRKERMRTVTISRKLTQVEKPCPVCGCLFWGATMSRYCSRACKSRADYQRHVEERRQRRVEKYRAEKKAAGRKK